MTVHVYGSGSMQQECTELDAPDTTRYFVPLGRALFAAIFIVASVGHFSSRTIATAEAQGVPLAHILVPLSGVMALVGGVSVLLGHRTRFGATLLALFLIPVTLTMHNFWAVEDPAMAQLQQIMFMKNTALLGASLLLMHFGAGPVSFDARESS